MRLNFSIRLDGIKKVTLQGMTRNKTKSCQSLRNTAAQRVTLLMRDTSLTHRIRMRENQLIHMSQNSKFCQNRVNLET